MNTLDTCSATVVTNNTYVTGSAVTAGVCVR